MTLLPRTSTTDPYDVGSWPWALNPSLLTNDPVRRCESIVSCFALRAGNRFAVRHCIESNGRFGMFCPDPCLSTLPNIITSISVEGGRYEIACLYDVLDHVPDIQTARETIRKALLSVKPSGFLFVRFHPLRSRLGTHLTKLNRAYWHVYHPDEPEQRHTLDLEHPRQVYVDLANSCGGTVEEVFPMFLQPERSFDHPGCEGLQFCDFIIRRPMRRTFL